MILIINLKKISIIYSLYKLKHAHNIYNILNLTTLDKTNFPQTNIFKSDPGFGFSRVNRLLGFCWSAGFYQHMTNFQAPSSKEKLINV